MKKFFTLLFIAVLAVTGCESDYTVLQSANGVILTADRSARAVGETITFTAKDNNNTDLTAQSEFYVNGNLISDNTFTTEEVGNYTVTAKYLGQSSSSLVVRFHDGSETTFTKRLLVEDYTGTWCGYCPRVAWAIEQLHTLTEDFVPVAIHRPSSNQSSSVYDPYNFDTTELEDIINIPGYPKGMLNRMTQWTFPEPDNLAQAVSFTQGANPGLGLALTPVVSNGNITIDVNIKFSSNFNGLKLVVYVLENGLLYEQHNYTDYYGSVDVIEDYHHNHVLRQLLTPLLGESIASAETTVGNTFTKTFNVAAAANIANTANIEFVAFVVDAQGKAINVRKAASGDVQEFEEE
ncbi:MAG: Omp28-related outer membrane protein [Bacteroidota bacterium]